MSETPQTQTTSNAQVPPQSSGPDLSSAAPAPSGDVTPAPYSGETFTPEPTRSMEWVAFASILLMMAAAFQVILGLTAVFDSGYYLVGENDLLVNVDYTAWGWTHVAIGLIALAAALGLLAGQTWARVTGVAIAVISAIVNLGFIAAYPFWSIMVIALDVLVIYAIIVHGKKVYAV
ncbi:MAG TPA: hypothetical protein VFT31_10910 [Kribbella sp.]|nr:hypothetical protein [Kribbella sp.]